MRNYNQIINFLSGIQNFNFDRVVESFVFDILKQQDSFQIKSNLCYNGVRIKDAAGNLFYLVISADKSQMPDKCFVFNDLSFYEIQPLRNDVKNGVNNVFIKDGQSYNEILNRSKANYSNDWRKIISTFATDNHVINQYFVSELSEYMDEL